MTVTEQLADISTQLNRLNEHDESFERDVILDKVERRGTGGF